MELLRGIDSNSVGAIITDPPYHISIGRAANWSQARGFGVDPWTNTNVSSVDEVIEWTRPHVEQAHRILRPGGALVVMGGTQSLVGWDLWCARMGLQWMAEIVVLWNTGKPRATKFGSLHTRVVWYAKSGLRHTFNTEARSIYSNVLVCRKVQRGKRHPAEKPVGLTNFLISLLTKEGDTVVDPFCGTGATLVSAVQCGRSYAGCDIEAEYVRLANNRIAQAEHEYPDPVFLWVNGRMEEV